MKVNERKAKSKICNHPLQMFAMFIRDQFPEFYLRSSLRIHSDNRHTGTQLHTDTNTHTPTHTYAQTQTVTHSTDG